MSGSWNGSRGRGNAKIVKSPAGRTSIEVKTVAGNGVQYKNTTIYITVDNSGSMYGSKLDQVIKSIQQIVDRVPEYCRFVFRSFSDEVKLLVTKKKKYLDINKVYSDLQKVGGLTALYDAWGQTMKEIDHQKMKSSTDNVYVLIFTDGQDNASKEHTLSSVMDLVGETIGECKNVQFSFVQAGRERKAVNALEKQFEGHPRCQVLNVEDSARGIEIAFDKVTQKIELVFRIEVNPRPSGIKHLVRAVNEHLDTKFKAPLKEIEYSNGSSTQYRPPPSYEATRGGTRGNHFREIEVNTKYSSHKPSFQNNVAPESEILDQRSSQLRRDVLKLANGYREENEDRPPNYGQQTPGKSVFSMQNLSSSVERLYCPPPPYAASANSTSYMSLAPSPCNPAHDICSTLGIDMDGTPVKPLNKNASIEIAQKTKESQIMLKSNENQSSSGWKLRVGNIPAAIEQDYVVYSFSKLGDCQLLNSGIDQLPHTRWVILSYATLQLREYAFCNMGGHKICGNTVTVCRY